MSYFVIPEHFLKTQSKPKFGENKQIEITNKRFAGWQIDLANVYFLMEAKFVFLSVEQQFMSEMNSQKFFP